MTWKHVRNYWVLSVSGFYGRAFKRNGDWFGSRGGESRITTLGPFDSQEEAQDCIESYARAHLEWLVKTGINQATAAQAQLH